MGLGGQGGAVAVIPGDGDSGGPEPEAEGRREQERACPARCPGQRGHQQQQLNEWVKVFGNWNIV